MLENIPGKYICPILRKLMHNPVLAADGHYYERAAIEDWFKWYDISFVTSEPLAHKRLVEGEDLQQAIKEFVITHTTSESKRLNPLAIDPMSTNQPSSLSSSLPTLVVAFKEAIKQNDITNIDWYLQHNKQLLTQIWMDGYTAFHLACEQSSFETLVYLSDQLADDLLVIGSLPKPLGWKPQHLDRLYLLLCAKHSTPLVEACLRMGANVNATYPLEHCSPLHEAVRKGSTSLAMLLLNYNINPYVPDNTGNLPLHLAAMLGHRAIVDILLKYGVSDLPNTEGLTAYYIALQFGHAATAMMLIKSPFDAGSTTSFSAQDNQQILSDFITETSPYVELANNSEKDEYHPTVNLLHSENVGGQSKFQNTVPLLNNYQVNTYNDSFLTTASLATPIKATQTIDVLAESFKKAILQNNFQIIDSIVESNKHLLVQVWEGGYTAFHLACEKSHFETVLHVCDWLEDDFLALGNLPLPLEWVPQHLDKLYLFLCSKRRAAFVETCLRMGANVNATYALPYRTTLHEAVIRGDNKIVKVLLDYRINPHVLDSKGNQALHLAAMLGHQPIVATLLKYGIIDTPNEQGLTAYALACQFSLAHIAKMLKQAHATTSQSQDTLLLPAQKSQTAVATFVLKWGRAGERLTRSENNITLSSPVPSASKRDKKKQPKCSNSYGSANDLMSKSMNSLLPPKNSNQVKRGISSSSDKWQGNSLVVERFKEAIAQNNIPAINSCLQLNNQLLMQTGKNGYSAFHLACERSRFETLLYICDLLEDKFLILGTFPAPAGWKPIHLDELYLFLCLKREAAYVKSSLRMGANVNAMYTTNYRTALHEAVARGDAELVKLLLEYNIDPYRANEQGDLALHLAVLLGQKACMTALLSYKVSDKPNRQGLTAYEMALKLNQQDLAIMLSELQKFPDEKMRAPKIGIFTSQTSTTAINASIEADGIPNSIKKSMLQPTAKNNAIKRKNDKSSCATTSRSLKKAKSVTSNKQRLNPLQLTTNSLVNKEQLTKETKVPKSTQSRVPQINHLCNESEDSEKLALAEWQKITGSYVGL